MKRCYKCTESKPLTEFGRDKHSTDGLTSACKPCRVANTLRWRSVNGDKVKAWRLANIDRLRAVERDRRSTPTAKKKTSERMRALRLADLENRREYERRAARKRADDPRVKEQRRARYEANKVKSLEQFTAWCKANPEKVKTRHALRRDATKRATPPWAKPEDFHSIYELAAIAEEFTGDEYHVDHIVPLRGKNVSGLNVPWNLRVVPAEENRVKGNRFIEELIYAVNS